jgi:choline dehydrogenase
MLSGIGGAEELRALDIPVVADLPGVGEDLQDHVDAGVKRVCTRPVTITPASRFPRNAGVLLRWLLFGTGPGATNHFETAGYIRTAPDRRRPNIQIAFIPLLATYDGSVLSEPHGFQATVMPLQPKSRGSVKLRANDPLAPPALRFNYLAEEDDLRELREGLRSLRRIFAQPAFDPYRGREIDPGEAVDSDASLEAFLRATTKSTHHPCSTCRMGTDDRAVVDENGRVRGLEGLRVVDSSILPRITSGNINAPTIMLAEKISDSILGKPALAPANLSSPSSAAQAAPLYVSGSSHED